MKAMLNVAAALTALLLSSCSFSPLFKLYNNVEGPVRIHLPGGDIPVDRGHAENFAISAVLDRSSDGAVTGGELVVVAAHSCVLTFRLDEIGDQLRWTQSQHVVPLQLERSFDLHFLPLGTHLPASATDLEVARRQGMVLQPRVSNCNDSHR